MGKIRTIIHDSFCLTKKEKKLGRNDNLKVYYHKESISSICDKDKMVEKFIEEKHGALTEGVGDKVFVCPYCSVPIDVKGGICFKCKYGTIGISRRMLGKVPLLKHETRIAKEQRAQQRFGEWLKLGVDETKNKSFHQRVNDQLIRGMKDAISDNEKERREYPDLGLLTRKGAGFAFFYSAIELGISAAINTGNSYHYYDYLSVSVLLDKNSYEKNVRIRQVDPFESVSSKELAKAVKKQDVGELVSKEETKREAELGVEAGGSSPVPQILPKINFSSTSTEELKKNLNSILVQRATYLGHWPAVEPERHLVCIDLQGTFKEPIPNTTTHVLWLEIPACACVLLQKDDSKEYAVLCTHPVLEKKEGTDLERFLETYHGNEIQFPKVLNNPSQKVREDHIFLERPNIIRIGDVKYRMRKLLFLPTIASIEADIVALGIIHMPRGLMEDSITGEIIGECEGKSSIWKRGLMGYRKVIMEKPFKTTLWEDYGMSPIEADLDEYFEEMVPKDVIVKLHTKFPYFKHDNEGGTARTPAKKTETKRQKKPRSK
ncbi:MAG: hypothetical protein V3W51_05590 [Candidatus Brocadiales bacterium]